MKLFRKSQAQVQLKPKEFSISELEKDILREAKVLGLSDSVAKMVAKRVCKRIEKWTEKRSAVTDEDLNRQIAKELKDYNADLAYVYQIRGKII